MTARPFAVGQQVRINAGQHYGRIGTIVDDCLADNVYLVRTPAPTQDRSCVWYSSTDLLDPHANNGD